MASHCFLDLYQKISKASEAAGEISISYHPVSLKDNLVIVPFVLKKYSITCPRLYCLNKIKSVNFTSLISLKFVFF